jgi:hypothetical protein
MTLFHIDHEDIQQGWFVHFLLVHEYLEIFVLWTGLII